MQKTIVVSPVAQLLQSRKFVMYVLTLIIMFLVPFVPALQPYASTLEIVVPLLGALLVTLIFRLDAKTIDAAPVATTPGAAITGIGGELKTAGLSPDVVAILSQALQLAYNSIPQPAPGTTTTITSAPTAPVDPASIAPPGAVA